MYKHILFILVFIIISCTTKNKPAMTEQKFTNSLIHETSPYLLQHAHNPVDWMAWNEESLALAKRENKLILISVGYSSCHWCHVMEHESFEDEEVAALMNEHFINIKVDREERPDIDQIYMNAVQLMTGSGGWPLNCVALPDGRPVWGGTYFPKKNWMNALEQLAKLHKENPNRLIDYAEKLTEGIKNSDLIHVKSNLSEFKLENMNSSVTGWKEFIDFELGGRNGAPKFPMPNNIMYLLRYAVQADDKELFEYVNTTLKKMAYGGIYDQVGGGFSRYSVDKKWHIPHFEKMLYDNGQLVSLYSKAFQITGDENYKKIVHETLEFIRRELTTKEGAFYSSLDADSLNDEGELEEGAFYVWSKEELQSILGQDYPLFSVYFNVNNYGYWEKNNYVLIRDLDDEEIAKRQDILKLDLQGKIIAWKNVLLKERNRKSPPRLDDKSLTSWNALMLKGYIDAYTVFGEDRFLNVALKNAHFIVSKLLQNGGSLNHSYKDGKSSINGYLEDYATVVDAFISLYEATLDETWLAQAKQLTDYVFDHFYDLKSSMFYFTSDLDPALITRKIETEDNVISASNSIMAINLFKLSHYYSNKHYLKVSKQMLSNMLEKVLQYPSSHSNWLQLMTDLGGSYYEIVISGPEAKEKLIELNKTYVPNKLIAGSVKKSALPLLKGRDNEKETFIYVCVEGACKLPEKNIDKAIKQLKIKF